MASEKYTNSGSSTLSGNINGSVTSLTVASAASFPSTGQFRIQIDNELMLVTAVSSNTFTVTRGAESTTAVSHTSGATTNEVLTAGALDTIRTDISGSDIFANRPAVEKAGKLWFPTDGISISRDDASIWSGWGPVNKLTEPIDANYSWVNQVSKTVTIAGGQIALHSNIDNTQGGRFKTAPATPYTIDIKLQIMAFAEGGKQWIGGVAWRESSSGKMVLIYLVWNGGSDYLLGVDKYNTTGSFNAAYITALHLAQSTFTPTWFRMKDDGSHRTSWVSADGISWLQLHSVTTGDFLTPDQVGIIVQGSGTLYDTIVSLQSWHEGS